MGLNTIFRGASALAPRQAYARFQHTLFPPGERDINRGTNRVLAILQHAISRDLARRIYTRASAVALASPAFDVLRLRRHLASYCLERFTDAQVRELHGFLTQGGRMR